MTITHDEFFRILPKALGSNNYTRDGLVITYQDKCCCMRITLTPERLWSIAGLELPVTDIEITINECTEQQASLLLKKFDRTYQRGGG